MTSAQTIANAVPHEFREKILLDWIPNATASLANTYMKLLWEAYFIYVEPDGIRKSDCPICINNVLNNWRSLQPQLIEAEKEYNILNEL